jgi:Gnt-I system high-affinity gluconate transporter
MPVSPLILAWSASALLRLALGSATVAAITAAGVVLPMIPGSGVAPELLVLATTAGSLMFSHFNDIGFWMFKEYYNLSVRQTFQIWTVMESIVAIVGLLGTLALSTVVSR